MSDSGDLMDDNLGEPTKFPSEFAVQKLFVRGDEWQNNAMLGCAPCPMDIYAAGYKDAADVFQYAKVARESSVTTMLVTPIPKVSTGTVKGRVCSRLSRERIHSCGQALSLCVLLTASVASAAPDDARTVQGMLQVSSPGSAATCARDEHGNITCTIDGTEIEAGDDCTSNMMFGVVGADQGVTLEGSFKRSAGNPVAHVGVGQLLCLQAAQRKEGVLVRALVMAIPTRTVKLCEDNEICRGADSPIEWKRPTTGIACTLKTDAHYAGDCASGWVEGKDIEEYSMGLKPEDTGD